MPYSALAARQSSIFSPAVAPPKSVALLWYGRYNISGSLWCRQGEKASLNSLSPSEAGLGANWILAPKMKVLGALVAMVPFASSLVPFGQPAAHQLAVGADRKGAPIVPKSSGLRQPRKSSKNKNGLGARLASALLPSLFEGGDEAEELPDEPEPSEAMRRSNSRDELMHRICD